MADHLGTFNASSTVHLYFTTHATDGAPVAPSSAFEAADLLIYKDGSATQRSSASGITMTSPFDSVTGLHCVAIDLSDNTDASFYAAGSEYVVILNADETVDSVAVTKVLAYFSIERVAKVNVTQFGGSAGTFSSGRPEVNTTHIAGTSQTARDIGASVLLSSGTGTGQLDFTSGRVKADTVYWNAAAVASPHTAGYPVITIKDGTGTGELDTALGTVIVGAFQGSIVPTNFNLLAINGSGHIERVVLTDTCTTATNLTNAPTSGDLTATMKTSVQTAATASLNAYDPPTNTEMEARTLVAASYATAANLSTVAGYLDTEIAAILADTNELQTDWADGGRLDLLLDAAGAAGDPWITTLPGSYTSGQAGYIIGTNLNATVSSRATQTSVDTIDTEVGVIDGNVDLILADTGTDGVVLSAATCNKIADHARRRTQANVEASSDGDTLGVSSLYGLIQQAQESNTEDNAGKLTVYRTDGTTELAQKTISTDETAEPITGIE